MSTVDVVIPVYNRTCYLGETIRSLLGQRQVVWRLVVVDDGSTEDVAGYVAQLADTRIRYVFQNNQGNATARNTGIRQTSAEYVACLDSDDVWLPDFLRTCVEYLAGHPDVDVAYTQVQCIGAEGQPLPRPVGPAPRNGDLLPDLLMGYPILPSSALVRRRCFDRWGRFTPGLDDWDLWLRWAANGCRFGCIERPLLQYRIHDQNFNLDYERRRAVHFAMLDNFYSQVGLPEAAGRLRERAYANQHFQFAVLAWQVGRPANGIAEFAAAVMHHTPYLADMDFHTQIACAHQGRIDAGTNQGLNLSVAESTLTQCLAALFSQADLPPSLRARRYDAYGWAYLALARLAYGMAKDMAHARRYLWRAACAWPALAWRSDWAAWLARSVLGYRRIHAAKHMLRREAGHA